VTQVGEESRPVDQAADAHAPGRVWIAPGTLMQKLIPRTLVEPYLTGQRWVIAGFVHRAEDAALLDPAWLRRAYGMASAGEEPGQDLWVLRWRALDMQTYHAAGAAGHGAGEPGPQPGSGQTGTPFDLFMAPGPIPVGTEMYQITPAGEEFIARHDGQAWLRPAPGK
jgi:hypothetical protein